VTRLDRDEALPAPGAFDLLAIMGGPMNIYEDAKYPWLTREKRFIESTLDSDVRVLGVCLGAQLIADVLGGTVTRNAHKEIGWFPVRFEAAPPPPFPNDWPGEFTAFHWHGDTFAIPPGATRLGGSEACANQAFVYGGRIVGLQFHIDYLERSIDAMLRHCADELVEGPWVQSPAEIRRGCEAHLDGTLALLRRLLGGLAD
jgi:GMP synthase-like glutamine amidotransferase